MILNGIEYFLAAPIAIILLATVYHVLRGIWRPFAARKEEGVPFTFGAQWAAFMSRGSFFKREAFSLDDFIFGIELDDKGYYELFSIRNWVIAIIVFQIAAILFFLLFWDKAVPAYIELVDRYMGWRFRE